MVDSAKFNRMIETVREKVNALDEDQVAQLNETMAIDFEEHFRFQNLQSEAHVMQLISTDAALIVYAALGEVGDDKNGGWASGTDLATKVVVTQFMGELLSRKIKQRV